MISSNKKEEKARKMIVVVCRGNITRSPFAEAVINQQLVQHKMDNKYTVLSRGTQGTPVDPTPVKFPNITFYKDEYRFSKPTLDKFKVDITNRVSKPIDRKIAEEASLILAVDEVNKNALTTLFPDLKKKIHKISELVGRDEDFTDPETVSGVEKHFQILSGLRNTIIKGFPKLLNLLSVSN